LIWKREPRRHGAIHPSFLRKETIMRFANWKPRAVVLGTAGLLLFGGYAAASPLPDGPRTPDPGPLIVHEWGTFLSVQESDGGALGGMTDSEEHLPGFVRERKLDGRPRWSIFGKMETPVTYFYVDQPRTVRVRVDMPRGLLTHWYPAVDAFGPPRAPKSN